MRLLRCGIVAAFLVLAACGSASSWDPLASVPEPVALPDGMDPRSALAFYAHGQKLLEGSPSDAAEAFYWASRLDPVWADPIYARRIALFMSQPYVFRSYLAGTRRVVTAPGVQRLDSLYLKALALNPFLRRQQDAVALRFVIVDELRQDPAFRHVTPGDIEFAVDSWLAQSGPAMRGWLAQSEGRFAEAARSYEQAIDRREAVELLVDLARVYVHMARFADARETMGRALQLLREREADRDELIRLYNSKALLEYSMGIIFEELDDIDEARAAYARALQEDLGYHPAHMRLGELALAEGDTLTALSEMALAADIRSADAGVSLRYGRVLAQAGQHEDAAAQFRRAAEMEPSFAEPHLELARARERRGRPDDALAEYRAFTDLASRAHPALGDASERIRALATNAAGSGS